MPVAHLIFEQLRWAMDRAPVRPAVRELTKEGWTIDLDVLDAATRAVVAEAAKIHFALPPRTHAITSTPAPAPLPYERWPRGARWLASRRQPSDTGVGDVVERMVATWDNRLAAGLLTRLLNRLKRLGLDCGCSDRQSRWNQQFPFDGPADLSRLTQLPFDRSDPVSDADDDL